MPDKMADNGNKSGCMQDNVTSSGEGWPSGVALPVPSMTFIAPVTALIVFDLLIIIGNSLVIAAVFTYRKLRTITNTFIVSLAVSDLLLGAVVLPFSSVNEVLGWWPFGRVWCSAWLAIDVWVCTASILNLCAISLDRYLAISRPFRYPVLMSPTRAKVAVAVVWTLALAICLPPLLGWKDSTTAADFDDTTNPTTGRPFDITGADFGLAYSGKSGSCVTGSGNEKTNNENLAAGWSINVNDRVGSVTEFGYVDAYEYQSSVDSSTASAVFRNALQERTTDSTVTAKRAPAHINAIESTSTFAIPPGSYDIKSRNKLIQEISQRSATDAPEVAGKIMRRSGTSVACLQNSTAEGNRRSDDRELVSAPNGDTLLTTASFNACQASITTSSPVPVCALTSEPGYIIYSACGSFWIPMLFMVFFYLKIYRTAVKATSALSSGVLTKKTGRISANSDVSAVNLRVHRGGGGGAARTSGGNWTPQSNRLSDPFESLPHRSSQYGSTADDDCDSAGSHQRRTEAPSTPEGGCFRRPSRVGGSGSGDRNRSRESTSGHTASAAVDETCRHGMPMPNGASSDKSSLKNSSPWSQVKSRHYSQRGKLSSTTNSSELTSATETGSQTTSRRRRVFARLSKDTSSVDEVPTSPGPDDGVESLLRSTLTPVFEHCSTSPLRSSGNCTDVELVDAAQAHSRRGFVQIRTQLRRLNREKKAAKTVGVIVGCFVFCWTPFFTVYVLGVFCPHCTPPIAFSIFFWLGYCNSAINPFVYALCSKDFRDAFRRLLQCGRGARRYGSNSTLAALISGLRTPEPRQGSQSAVQFSAVSKNEKQ